MAQITVLSSPVIFLCYYKGRGRKSQEDRFPGALTPQLYDTVAFVPTQKGVGPAGPTPRNYSTFARKD